MLRNELRRLWEDLRSSLWFVPTLIVFGGVVLAVGLIEADAWLGRQRLIYGQSKYKPRMERGRSTGVTTWTARQNRRPASNMGH
jgi:hypothetical protein